MNVLLALMGNTQLVKECLAYNGILCLLYVFCCQQDEEVRKAACEVLCKMTSDKLMGPKVRGNFKKGSILLLVFNLKTLYRSAYPSANSFLTSFWTR